MKSNGFCRTMVGAAAAAGFCLVQGCSTIHSGGEAEDMRLRPLPDSLDPAPVEVVQPAVPAPVVGATETGAPRKLPLTPQRLQLTTSYTVKPGDSLTAIAYRYKLRWQDVAAVNPGIAPNKLYVGDVIQLPGKVDVAKPLRALATSVARPASVKNGAASYTVKAGDSLSVVAQRHGVKTADLRKANNLTGDKIVVGQKLVIPGAKTAAVSQAATPPAPPAPVAPPAPPAPPPAPAPDPLELAPLAPLDAEPGTGAAVPAGAVPADPAAPAPVTEVPPAPPLPAPAAAAPAAPAAGYQSHTVAPGEDLYSVAIRWSVGTADIKAANNLTGSELVPGTVLKIPPAPAP